MNTSAACFDAYHSDQVIANFAPWSGVYMFHCHNLVHEDHDMMAAFNISDVDLTAYGYGDKVRPLHIEPTSRSHVNTSTRFRSSTPWPPLSELNPSLALTLLPFSPSPCLSSKTSTPIPMLRLWSQRWRRTTQQRRLRVHHHRRVFKQGRLAAAEVQARRHFLDVPEGVVVDAGSKIHRIWHGGSWVGWQMGVWGCRFTWYCALYVH